MNYDGSPLGYFTWCLEEFEEFRRIPYRELRTAARRVWDDLSFLSCGQYIRAHRQCKFTGVGRRVQVHSRHRVRVARELQQRNGGTATNAENGTAGPARTPEEAAQAVVQEEPRTAEVGVQTDGHELGLGRSRYMSPFVNM